MTEAARELAQAVGSLKFPPPVRFVYNPLIYAWAPHELYLRRFANTRKRVIFLGMNPGPFGMAQTGVPFGEIVAVREWMQIEAPVAKPDPEHPKRPVIGFDCARSEVSGQRLWRLFADRFGSAEKFFAEHLVVNYCPLIFLEETGRNRTPVQLPAEASEPLFGACDRHLRSVLELLQPQWLVGVGNFAADRARRITKDGPIQVGQILHPSPASPAANRDWANLAATQLETLGIWRTEKF
jgi:single-strand selective monofunctional uracil DNA glycosylase